MWHLAWCWQIWTIWPHRPALLRIYWFVTLTTSSSSLPATRSVSKSSSSALFSSDNNRHHTINQPAQTTPSDLNATWKTWVYLLPSAAPGTVWLIAASSPVASPRSPSPRRPVFSWTRWGWAHGQNKFTTAGEQWWIHIYDKHVRKFTLHFQSRWKSPRCIWRWFSSLVVCS